MLSEFAGRRCIVLPVRTFGQRCGCFNATLNKRTRSGCPTCFDTGFIRGYMYPTRSQTGLRSFVMSRDNGVCPYCLPNPKLTDQVFVELIGGREATYTTRLIGVGGIFSMKFKDPKKKYGGIVYHIEADYLR